jgi:O-antigen ligase
MRAVLVRHSDFFEFKYLCLALILLFLPFSYRLANITIVALFIYSIIKTYTDRKPLIFYKKISFYIPSTIVIIALVGLLNSTDLKSGFEAIERLSPLLIFPLIFTQLGISDPEFVNLKKFFIAILLLMILVLECRVLWLLINSTEHEFFRYFFSYYYTYENLTTSFLAQPIYLGSFVTLSSIFCLNFTNNEKEKSVKWLLILTINTFFLFQLGARSSLLINIAVIVFFIGYVFYKKKKVIVGALLIVSLLTFSVLLLASSGFTRLRMQSILSEFTTNNIFSVDPQSRMLIWPCALEIIEDHWVLGVGTGDAESLLVEAYKEHGFEELYNAKLNAHNQYLTLIMRHGLLGVFIILINIILPLYIYIKSRRIEAFLFTFLMTGFFLTENVLGRAQGVIFFSFFHTIYLTVTLDNSKYENTGIWNQLLSGVYRDR